MRLLAGGCRAARVAATAVVVVAAALAAACGMGESAAYQAYKTFVGAVVRGDCDTLYAMAEQEALAYVDGHCKRRSIVLMGKTIDLGSPASNLASIRPHSTPFNDPISLERTIESETRSPDSKSIDLVVLEKSYQRRGSVREPSWLRRHTVSARLHNGQWKLTRFREEILRDYGGEEAARQSAAEKQGK
ncbi:MAG: hypothetical protein JNK75_01350 [Betaproteobacteria bacterium]|nr:hypothetical protein [Betaproteobacteria bacterium]